MRKQAYKTLIRNDDGPALREVKGYFTWLGDVRVFIYRDVDRMYAIWYVIDLETGMSIEDGKTMTEAKRRTLNKLDKFKKFKESDYYKQQRILYNKLLNI